jgi:hypothetical protein
VLFLTLSLIFVGIAWAAAVASQWFVAAPAAVIGLWIATMAVSAFRGPRRAG